MQDCTHLSRFALVSRAFPGRNAKKYTGYCIIACVLTWHVAPKKILILGGICLRQGFWGNMQRLSLTGCDILCSFECEPKKISTLYVC